MTDRAFCCCCPDLADMLSKRKNNSWQLSRHFCHMMAVLACLLLTLPLLAESPPQDKVVLNPVDCEFTSTPIEIDGNAEEDEWKRAMVLENFTQPWRKENPKARMATKARLLWDREYLYFFADMDDSDLYADVKEHDGETWNNDVFELFFKPAADKPGYYEFQVNAAGAIMDMFIPRRNAGGFGRFIADGDFHIDAKVVRRGSLNDWHDRDEGWSVEGRIPWKDFLRTGGRPEVNEIWKFALCRYDYSVDFEGPELSTTAPLSSKANPDFHYFEDYAELRFVGPALNGLRDAKGQAIIAAQAADRLLQLREQLPKVTTTVVGSPDPPPPYRAKRVRPELKPSFPIFVAAEPGSPRLILIDQKWSYGPARIARTTEKAGELETLWEFPTGGVGYSLAFHPQFEQNGYLYVGWNGGAAGVAKDSVITRITLDRESPFAVVPHSEVTILRWPSDGHNGAAIAFGADGMLYITSGDGTSDSDTNVAGQGLDQLLAKLLRIDVDRPPPDRMYSVPKDNPFVDQANVRPETFAYGFRNPWRLSIDQLTGQIWVGNNGQDLWEQVYLVERGANYGWSVFEGSHPFYENRQLGPTPVSQPRFEHSHSEARSLTGGIVYRGKLLPELQGAYLYGDYSTGKIWAGKVADGKLLWHREIADTTLQITSFGLDPEGELLISDHRGSGEGGLYTLEIAPPRAPATFPQKLSETGLFTSVVRHQVHSGLLPYSVNAPLWSDGAYKVRYLYLPPGAKSASTTDMPKIDFSSDDRGWNFPEGTIAVKSFALETSPGDAASRHWIETRLFTKQEGEWAGYSYAWNEEQTEATLVGAAGFDREFVLQGVKNTSQTWHYPSRTECMVCHSRAANFVLGLCTPQMNRAHDYGGTALNQLDVWEALGLLRVNAGDGRAVLREEIKTSGLTDEETDKEVVLRTASRDQREAKASSLLFKPTQRYPKMVDPLDATADLTARAKSYLHANCAQCHQEAGGGNAQLQLTWSTPLEKMRLIDETPLHHKFDLAGAKMVAPGDPDRSVLLHRMAMRGRGQMPQLATNLVDEAGVGLMQQWIRSLQQSPSDRGNP